MDVRVGLWRKLSAKKIDAFELWCWRRLLRVPWTARRSNQSILKEISPGCSLEGLMLKLKLQYFGHLMRRVDSWKRPWCWEGLGAGEGDDREWDGWMASPTWWTWVWVDSGSWWWTGRPTMLCFMGLQRVGHDWVTELNWTEHTNKCAICLMQVWSGIKCNWKTLSNWFRNFHRSGFWCIHIFLVHRWTENIRQGRVDRWEIKSPGPARV